MSCECRCHAGGAYPACDRGYPQPGGELACAMDHDDAPACVLGHVAPAERFVGLVCRQHYHRIGDTLRQVEELFALIPDVLQPRVGGDGGLRSSALRHRVSSGLSAVSSGSRVDAAAARRGTATGSKHAHSPAPGRLDAMALTDRRDPASALSALELTLRFVLVKHRWPDRDTWSRLAVRAMTVSEITGALHRQRRGIAGQAWVVGYVEALTYVHETLAAAVGVTMWPQPIGACPNCQARMYAQPNPRGVDEVTCRKCKTTWRGVHLARLRLIHEQEAAGA